MLASLDGVNLAEKFVHTLKRDALGFWKNNDNGDLENQSLV